jgi:hypothetical protein
MKATSGKKSEYILGNLMIEHSEKTHYFLAVVQFDSGFEMDRLQPVHQISRRNAASAAEGPYRPDNFLKLTPYLVPAEVGL